MSGVLTDFPIKVPSNGCLKILIKVYVLILERKEGNERTRERNINVT